MTAHIVRTLQLAAIGALVECLDLERIMRPAIAAAMRGNFSLRDCHGCATSSVNAYVSANVRRCFGCRPYGAISKGARLARASIRPGGDGKRVRIAIFRKGARFVRAKRRAEISRWLQLERSRSGAHPPEKTAQWAPRAKGTAPRKSRQRVIAHELIGLALLTKGAGGAMAGNEGDIFAQRPEALGNAVDQVLMIAAREIGAPN